MRLEIGRKVKRRKGVWKSLLQKSLLSQWKCIPNQEEIENKKKKEGEEENEGGENREEAKIVSGNGTGGSRANKPEKKVHENIHLGKSTSSSLIVTTNPWRREGHCHYSHFEVRKLELMELLSDSSSIHRLCHLLKQKPLGSGLDSKPGAALCLCGLWEEGKTAHVPHYKGCC